MASASSAWGASGLPLALSFADRGLRVVGIDNDPRALGRADRMPFEETGAQELLERVLAAGTFTRSASPPTRRARDVRRPRPARRVADHALRGDRPGRGRRRGGNNHSDSSSPEALDALQRETQPDCLVVDPWNTFGVGQVFAYANEFALLSAG